MSGRDSPEQLAWRDALSWLDKAAEDAKAVRLVVTANLISLAAFHVQQATEKALKALLTAAAQDVRRIHDVAALAELARVHWPLLVCDPFPLVTTRYPGTEDEAPTVKEIDEALQTVESLIQRIVTCASGPLGKI